MSEHDDMLEALNETHEEPGELDIEKVRKDSRFALEDNNHSLWGVHQAQDILASSPFLKKLEIGKDRDAVGADALACAFNYEPEVVPCTDKDREMFFKEFLETQTTKSLRLTTKLDFAASSIATYEILEAYAQFLKDKKEADTPEAAQEVCEEAAQEAAAKAEEAVEEYDGFRKLMGVGDGEDKGLDGKKVADLFRKVRGNPRWKRLVNLQGRFKLSQSSQKRFRTIRGAEEVTGVTLGGDMTRLTASEQVFLANPITRLDTMRRIMDRQAMVKEMHSNEKLAKGPIVVLCDGSSSMKSQYHDNITVAKALCMAIADSAKKQRRWVALVEFGGPGQVETLVLDPRKWDAVKLCAWLNHFFNGGTWPPLGGMEALWESIGATKGRTDMVMITDGEVYIKDGDGPRFLEFKKKANALMTVVGLDTEGGTMKPYADSIYRVNSLEDISADGIRAALTI